MRFPFICVEALFGYLKIKCVEYFFFNFPFFSLSGFFFFLEAGKYLLFPESMEIMICLCVFACEVSQRIFAISGIDS